MRGWFKRNNNDRKGWWCKPKPEVVKPAEKPVENDKPITRAVLIGINYTGTRSELRGCINDTRNVFMWLTQDCGYDSNEIRAYTDEKYSPDDRIPTRQNICQAIKWLHEPVKSAGGKPVHLFLHYSGHGSWTYDRNGDESDGRDESICPLDYAKAGCIVDDELKRIVVDPIANNPNVKLSCLFDCCHSGTALDLRYDHEVKVKSNDPDKRAFTMIQRKSYQPTLCDLTLWSGCLDSQTSADAYISRTSQGAMTWGFLSVIRKYQKRGKKLTFKRVLAEVQILLAESGFEQIPHLSSGKLIGLGDEILF
jgi:hypothetical protein